MSTSFIGGLAEDAVARELEKQGYEIIVQNWKTKYAEIDVLAKKGRTLYFVEVKFRTTDLAGDGFDYITSKKLNHMQRAAEAWVTLNDWQGPYELKAAAVKQNGEEFEIDIREI